MTLQPGAAAEFTVTAIDSDPYPYCHGTRVGSRIRVYPPNQTASLVERGNFEACRLTVDAVRSATG